MFNNVDEVCNRISRVRGQGNNFWGMSDRWQLQLCPSSTTDTGNRTELSIIMCTEGRDIWLTGSFSALSRYTTKMAEEGGSPALLERLSFLFRVWEESHFFNVNVWPKDCLTVYKMLYTNILYSRITSSMVKNQWKWVTQTCSSRSVLGNKDNHSSLKWTRPDWVSFKVNH